jgi:hypothetical protein
LFNLVYNSTTNSQSSPFYNYGTDALYVGDDGGKLWKVTGVFNGTPALATGGWASGLSIGVSQKLTGPVFDFNSNKILAGDDAGGMNTFNDSGSFGSRNATKFSSITDPPVLDGSTGKVHFFGVSLGAGNPQVVQTDATLSSFVTATAGTATGVTPKVHAGAFDNHYLSDATPVNGFVYMCGRASASTSPSLYRIGFNSSGVMSATADGNSLALGSTTTAECSPLTEIYNSGQTTDWIFVGVPGTCAAGGSTTGCVESVNVTSGFPGSIVAAGQSSGGTSGIVVDNVSSSGHASSLYYSTLGAATCTTASGSSSAGGCAVQRTQSGLQ